MAKKRGRGGYRRPTPTNKNAVSGPGALSQRTDGTQPVMRGQDMAYGESGAYQAQQQAAPLGAGTSPTRGDINEDETILMNEMIKRNPHPILLQLMNARPWYNE